MSIDVYIIYLLLIRGPPCYSYDAAKVLLYAGSSDHKSKTNERIGYATLPLLSIHSNYFGESRLESLHKFCNSKGHLRVEETLNFILLMLSILILFFESRDDVREHEF